MGSMGTTHTLHPYIVQNIAFLLSLLFPAAIIALIVGAIRERALRYTDATTAHRRRQGAHALYRRGLRRISQAVSSLFFL